MRAGVLCLERDLAEGPVREAMGLALALGVPVESFVLGDGLSGVPQAAGDVRMGVHPALGDPDPETAYQAALALMGDAPPELLLMAEGQLFESVGARLAGHYGRTAVRDVGRVELAGDGLRLAKAAFGGKAEAVLAGAEAAVVALRAGAFAQADAVPAGVETVGLDLPAPVERQVVRESEGEDLGRARVVVSGGRGMGSAEGYQGLRALADLLGAALGASRAAVDEGWASPSQQVGITGRKVAPELYLAIGISGASQHLSGMSQSRQVVAVNKDEHAPIFAAADIGVVADWQQLWPHLKRALGG